MRSLWSQCWRQARVERSFERAGIGAASPRGWRIGTRQEIIMIDEWFYMPFARFDVAADAVFKDAAEALRKSGRNAIAIDYKAEFRTLGVKPDANLILGGHGLKINKYLYIGSKGVQVTANELAEQLDTDCHMDKKQLSILLVSCEAGGTSSFTNAEETEADSEVFVAPAISEAHTYVKYKVAYNCFASVLAIALGLRGFSRIHVGGWPGMVVIVDPLATSATQQHTLFHSTNSTTDTTECLRADDTHIQWFDSKGNDAVAIFKSRASVK
jgi:hypothetical protein